MRAWDKLRAMFEGRSPPPEPADAESEAEPRDELPRRPGGLAHAGDWVSSQPRPPRQPQRIIVNIRAKPADAVGDLSRPAALGTLLEGAMAFALDDAVDRRCESIEVRLQRDGSAIVEHAGPGYDPQRAFRGCQRWPWLRRSPAGEVMLTRSFAAPVVTCALSHWLRVEISRVDGLWRGAFYRGQPEGAIERHPALSGGLTYTRVSFRPDPTVFDSLSFSIDDLYMRGLGLLMELSDVELRIYDERTTVPPLVIIGTGHLV